MPPPAIEKLRDPTRPLAVTFQRAFDRTLAPSRALADLIGLGLERVLNTLNPRS